MFTFLVERFPVYLGAGCLAGYKTYLLTWVLGIGIAFFGRHTLIADVLLDSGAASDNASDADSEEKSAIMAKRLDASLRSELASNQVAAAEMLCRIMRTGRLTRVYCLPALTDMLASSDPTVRAAAAKAIFLQARTAPAIFRHHPQAAKARQALERTIQDENPNVRVYAAQALACFGRADSDLVQPILEKLLKDDDKVIRSHAADALAELRSKAKAAEAIAQLLRRSKAGIPPPTNWEHDDYKKLKMVLKELHGKLLSRVPSDQILAAEELKKIGMRGIDCLPDLIQVLESPHPGVRAAAAKAMFWQAVETTPVFTHWQLIEGKAVYTQNSQAPKARLALVTFLGDTEDSVRLDCARALALYSPADAKLARPVLEKLLQNEQKMIRFDAAGALARMGKDGKAAIPVLVQFLDDGDWWFAANGAGFLGLMGPTAKPALPALVEVLKNVNRPNLRHAALAVARISPGNKRAVQALISLMSPANPLEVRAFGAEAIAEMGEEGAEAIPALLSILQLGGEAQMVAIEPLRKMGKAARKEGVPALIQVMLDDQSPLNVRERAIRVAGELGTDSQAALPVLINILRSSDKLRAAASHAIGNIGPTAIPFLLEVILDEKAGRGSFGPREAAFSSLGDMVLRDDKEAFSTLIELVNHENRYVRERAASRLDQIEGIKHIVEIWKQQEKP